MMLAATQLSQQGHVQRGARQQPTPLRLHQHRRLSAHAGDAQAVVANRQRTRALDATKLGPKMSAGCGEGTIGAALRSVTGLRVSVITTLLHTALMRNAHAKDDVGHAKVVECLGTAPQSVPHLIAEVL